ncbi:MAG: hypothetical protein LUH82_07075 [Clostridiales bacterium]|nr:hypothetical protein [Clostridiales bacterium]
MAIKKSILIFIILFVLTLLIPAVVFINTKSSTSGEELATLFSAALSCPWNCR